MSEAARQLLRTLQRLVPRCPQRLTTLAGHLVGAGTASPVDVSEEAFKAWAAQLSRRAHVVPLHEVLRKADTNKVVNHLGGFPMVALTFDDAYENFYTHVYPVLQEHGLPATLFVPTGFIDGKTSAPISGTSGLKACSWSQLREMHASGLVTLGAHTCTHPDLPKVSAARARWELEESKERIEDETGAPVEVFCYPRGLWTGRDEELARESYKAAVVGGGRAYRLGEHHPMRIGRVPLTRNTPSDLDPILHASVWLEEWIADQVRHRIR